jgi:hypothetical protein
VRLSTVTITVVLVVLRVAFGTVAYSVRLPASLNGRWRPGFQTVMGDAIDRTREMLPKEARRRAASGADACAGRGLRGG